MRFYCPNCWSDFAEDMRRCPQCGQDIPAFLKEKDYVERLIVALNHPEPETPMRAAWILGQLRDERAVEPLINLLGSTQDVYIARAVVEALDQIGTPRALEVLSAVADSHPADMVRERARAAVTKKPDNPPATPEGDIAGIDTNRR